MFGFITYFFSLFTKVFFSTLYKCRGPFAIGELNIVSQYPQKRFKPYIPGNFDDLYKKKPVVCVGQCYDWMTLPLEQRWPT